MVVALEAEGSNPFSHPNLGGWLLGWGHTGGTRPERSRPMSILWLVIGALIGAYAAQRKGFSMLGGILGGALLGPLARRMFSVPGVSRADKQKKCPWCAEWIKAEANVCRHCHRSAAPSR